jgi:hypothetical protein
LSSSCSTSATRLVIAAPICAHRPCLPTDPPNAKVTTVASSFTDATRPLIFPDLL